MPIITFTLKFVVEQPTAFQSYSGFPACGVFYNLVKSVDSNLAEELHSSKRLAPWSTTPIYKEVPPPRRAIYRRLPAPSIASVTFTTFDNKLAEVIKEAILKPELEVELGDVKAKVINVAVNVEDFSRLADCEPLPDKFAVKFETPTVFRRSVFDCCQNCPLYVSYSAKVKEGLKLDKPCKHAVYCRGMMMPLPTPSLMFRNLARLWSSFSDFKIDALGAARWAELSIAVSGFKLLKTVRVYEHVMSDKWIAGFVGPVRFAIVGPKKEKYARAAAALLKFAEFSNVGVRRTAGLGVVKLVIPQAGEIR